MKNEIPVAGVAHQAGTCRMGADPDTSVLNADCRAHELDNLYVVDTSVFPSIGAVNPALTAMANSSNTHRARSTSRQRTMPCRCYRTRLDDPIQRLTLLHALRSISPF